MTAVALSTPAAAPVGPHSRKLTIPATISAT